MATEFERLEVKLTQFGLSEDLTWRTHTTLLVLELKGILPTAMYLTEEGVGLSWSKADRCADFEILQTGESYMNTQMVNEKCSTWKINDNETFEAAIEQVKLFMELGRNVPA